MDPNQQNPNSNPEPSQPPQNTPSTPPFQQSPPPVTDDSNGIAIAGLILAFLIPLIGLILSIIGLVKAKHRNGKNQGVAIAGIVLSIIFTIIGGSLLIVAYTGIMNRSQQTGTTQTNTSQTSPDGTNTKAELGSIYHDTSGHYSLKLPKDWVITQAPGSHDTYAIAPAKSNDSDSRINIYFNKLFQGESLATITKSELAYIKINKGTVTSQKNVTINGATGHEIIARENDGANTSEDYVVILVKADSVYKLTYQTPPTYSATNLPLFKASAESFTAK